MEGLKPPSNEDYEDNGPDDGPLTPDEISIIETIVRNREGHS